MLTHLPLKQTTQILLCAFLFFFPPPLYAASPKDLRDQFVRTQEALALGDMVLFVSSLKQLEITYLGIQSSLSEEDREQYQLWIHHFQFKRYHLQGTLPPIRDIRSFEDTKAIQSYVQIFDNATQSLQKALIFLRRYNQLYNRIALSQDLRAQINLQASLSLERDLDTLIRQSQIYIALLRFALDNWTDRKKIKQRLQQQDRTLNDLREQQRRATVQQDQIAQEQQRTSKRIQSAQAVFLNLQQDIESRQASSTTLIIIGSILMVLGASSTAIGVLALLDAEKIIEYNRQHPHPTTTPLPDTIFPKQETCPNGDAPFVCNRDSFQLLGYATLGAGAGGLALGITFVILGVVGRPHSALRQQAVLKSQQHFLKDEESSPRSSLPPPSLHNSPRILGFFR